MYNILVPVDPSDYAEAAASVAVKIALHSRGKVTFMHLLATPVDWVSLTVEEEGNFPEVKQEITEAKAMLNRFKELANETGVQSEHVLEFSQEVKGIVDHASKHGNDLIVMGSHGTSGVIGALLGTKTQHVIRQATAPVLVVKQPIVDFPPKQVVFASSFREEVGEAFAKIASFVHMMGGYIKLLYVNDRENFETTRRSKARMAAFRQQCVHLACEQHVYNAENPEKGILQFAEDQGADLIALATHGRTGLAGMLKQSLTEQIVNHASLPVLSVHIETGS